MKEVPVALPRWPETPWPGWLRIPMTGDEISESVERKQWKVAMRKRNKTALFNMLEK